MNSTPSPLLTLVFFNALLVFSICFPKFLCDVEEGFRVCESFDCGEFKGIGYPFWGNRLPAYCGHPNFKLDCRQNHDVTINISSQEFRVLDINSSSQIMKIARKDLRGSRLCPRQYADTSLDFNFFHFTSNDENLTLLYECDPPSSDSRVPQKFTCSDKNGDEEEYWVSTSSMKDALRCNISIPVPVLSTALQNYTAGGYSSISDIVEEGFEVRWEADEDDCENCKQSGGKSGSSVSGFYVLYFND